MNKHILFWVLTLLFIFVFLFLFENILTPFIVALILTYLLNPIVNWLTKKGLPRGIASFSILLSAFVFIAFLLVQILPLLYAQIITFITKMPSYMSYIKEQALPFLNKKLSSLPFEVSSQFEETVQDHIGTFASWFAEILSTLISSSFAFYNFISFLIIMPIAAFYLMRDWPVLLKKIATYFPKKYRKTLNSQARELDQTLAGFLRGQGTVCLTLGTYYAISLTMIGLDFGLFIGFLTGLLTFIPYAGAFIGFIISLMIGYFQFGITEPLAYIALIFILGQSAEGNILMPRLVGSRVKLHPLWILFSLLAGAELFGFVGILLAVPIAALIGVLVRFLFDQYFRTYYYQGKKRKQPIKP